MIASAQNKRHKLAARMQLLAVVKLASEYAAMTWPMHTFIHHNPLHDLEKLDFETAVQQGKIKMGGEGYLSNETFRRYFENDRITAPQLDAVLQTLVFAEDIPLSDRSLSHLEVLRAHFQEGISAPAPEILSANIANSPDRDTILLLAKKLQAHSAASSLAQKFEDFPARTKAELGLGLTLSMWFDDTYDCGLVEELNQEMIKWCLPFLDEGQAPWTLPLREKGLYACWKTLAAQESDCGRIDNISEKIAQTPETAAEMLLDNLDALGIPETHWEDYLGLHLSAMPGYTALIKWRGKHSTYDWQDAYPIDLLQYLAIRLWYEREWCEQVSQRYMGVPAKRDSLLVSLSANKAKLFLNTEQVKNNFSISEAQDFARLTHRGAKTTIADWDVFAKNYIETNTPRQQELASLAAGWQVQKLANVLKISSETLHACPIEGLKQILSWITSVPESQHGLYWLKAFEAGYQEGVLQKLSANLKTQTINKTSESTRPQAQAVFCIDVRSESFRRHFEESGDYESYGFAGFFSAFIRYLAFGSHHEVDLFPAVGSAKNFVKELPLASEEKKVGRHRAGATFIHASHTLLHDLKENVVTPYVMVESIGWFFGIPLIGKTLFPNQYRKGAERLKRWLTPPLSTTLTIDKKTRESVDQTIASEQRKTISGALKSHTNKHLRKASSEQIELLRTLCLRHCPAQEVLNEVERRSLLQLVPDIESVDALVHILREDYVITEAWASARMERITRTGFTQQEQSFTVRMALQVMGLTKNFARLVLFCGHGSVSANNPYEAALDCGACGGNPGNANARVVARLANLPSVRKSLKAVGIVIPDDTYFIAGLHNTTTDEVTLYDLEDLPGTHLKALESLQADLKKAGANNSLERCGRFPDVDHTTLSPESASLEVKRRSATWNQPRPEWGLSGNAAIVISSGALIKGVDLGGRVFLHSYRQEEDESGQNLEVIMTGAQVVAQWISMEHYFSTTDNEAYGSGSKIFHNVAGRIGLMTGASSDLRIGLPWQTVGNGDMPFHEAMRLFTVIEAPRNRVSQIIGQHTVLKTHFNKQWVHLVALDEGQFYRYRPDGCWEIELLTETH